MLTFMHAAAEHLDGVTLALQIYCAAVASTAITAVFAPSAQSRRAALRVLRALVRHTDDDD